MKEIRLVLVGYGVVTKSLVELLVNEKQRLYHDHGLVFHVVAAADTKGAVISSEPLPAAKLNVIKMDTGSVAYYPGLGQRGITGLEAIELTQADILVECTPTDLNNGEPGLTHIRTALAKGMSVVTANKGPLVLAWDELHALAKQKGVKLLYGAAASAGLPVIELGRALAETGELMGLEGVLNATTNFVLGKMAEGGTLDDAVKEAQRRGFAEANPSLDLEGWDTAVKLLILTNAVTGRGYPLSTVEVEGIISITPEEVRDAQAAGQVIKLVGKAALQGDQAKLTVAPQRLPADHPLASVSARDKGIIMTTSHLGQQVHFARGPMRSGTAATMLVDLIHAAKSIGEE